MLALSEARRLEAIAHHLRLTAFETILNAGSGHVGACSSSAEILTSLYFGGILRYDPADPRHPNRDRLLIRGHLGPLRYSIFAALGWIETGELFTYRRLGSRLQGHESMEAVPGVDITPSGSLGMLLSYGVGAALALKARGSQATTYVCLGDGEEQEGNVSEAARHAATLGLTNVVAILDQNQKQLSNPTASADGGADVVEIWKGYGWDVRVIDNGHSITELLATFRKPRSQAMPTLYVTKTTKGLGVEGCEQHFSGYHTLSTCGPVALSAAVKKLRRDLEAEVNTPQFSSLVSSSLIAVEPLPPARAAEELPTPTTLEIDDSIDDFDEALVAVFRTLVLSAKDDLRRRLYVLTADWNNRDQVAACTLDAPWVNYFDVGIREQHMVGVAHGIAVSDPAATVIVFDGDAFAYRAMDQLHAVAQAGSNIIIIGTDSGLCEARNGPTHQSEGQPGALLTMPGLTLLEPADTRDLATCFNRALAATGGPVYLRLHSGKTAPICVENRSFPAYICHEPTLPVKLNLIASGIVIGHAIQCAKEIEGKHGFGISVVNVLEMEALDERLAQLLDPTAPTMVAFNGNPAVLRASVTAALLSRPAGWPRRVVGHGFTRGTSGSLRDLLEHFCLDAPGLTAAVEQTLEIT